MELLGSNTWWDRHCEQKVRSELRGLAGKLVLGLQQIPDRAASEEHLETPLAFGALPRAALDQIEAELVGLIQREYPHNLVEGMLLHMRYGDTPSLAPTVLNTDMHMRTGNSVKFAAIVVAEPLGAKFIFPVFAFIAVIRKPMSA